MGMKSGFINVYRSGHFHREGKPNSYDRHGGDIYESYAMAEREISPREFFIATVPVTWFDPEDIRVNREDSVPVPLSITRNPAYRARLHAPDVEHTSLETSEADARLIPQYEL